MTERNGNILEVGLREKPPSRKSRGVFLLIPLLLAALIWLQANTGLDKNSVNFYFQMLVASSLMFLFLAWVEPKSVESLKKIKPILFLSFYLLLFVIVIGAFMIITLMATQHITLINTSWELAVNYMAITCIIVAPVETLMFQYVLPKTITLTLSGAHIESIGGGVAQVGFGFFHWATYGGDLSLLLAAVILGFVFYTLVLLSPRWGLGAAMGCHAGWNISVSFFNLKYLGGILGTGVLI